MNNRASIWLAVTIFVTLLTFVLSSLSSISVPTPVFKLWKHMDWVLHAIEYGFLALCLLEYLYESHHSVRRFAFTLTFPVLFCGVIGGLNELWQAQIPHRTSSWADVVANSVGATIATVSFILLKRPWLVPRKGFVREK